MPSLNNPAGESRAIQILACGNTLRGDDGIGFRIATLLEARPPCDGLQVTFTPQLLPEQAEIVSAADRVIFIDCSAVTPPGTVSATCIEPATRPPTSFTHHLDPSALLRLAQDLYGRAPAGTMLVTVGGESFDLNDPLSAAVTLAIPEALDAIRCYCQRRTRPMHGPCR